MLENKSSPQPQIPKKKTVSDGMLAALLGFLALGLIGAIAWQWDAIRGVVEKDVPEETVVADNMSEENPVSTSKSAAQLTEQFQEPVDRTGWKTYHNTTLGYTVQYPADWAYYEVQESDEHLSLSGESFAAADALFYPSSMELFSMVSSGDELASYTGEIAIRQLPNPDRLDARRFINHLTSISDVVYDVPVAHTTGTTADWDLDLIVLAPLDSETFLEIAIQPWSEGAPKTELRGMIQSLVYDNPAVISPIVYDNPATLWWDDLEGYIHSISLDGTQLLLSNFGQGMQIYDVSTPARPALLGTDATDPEPWFAVPYGDYAFVKESHVEDRTGVSTIRVLDISNPQNMQEVGVFPYDAEQKQAGFTLLIQDDVAYTQTDSSLSVFDLTDPANPSRTGALEGSNVQLSLIGIGGGYLFATASEPGNYRSEKGVDVFDVADPRWPRITGTITGWSYYDKPGVVLGDFFLSLKESNTRLEIYSPTDTSTPMRSLTLPSDIQVSEVVSYDGNEVIFLGLNTEYSLTYAEAERAESYELAREDTAKALYRYTIAEDGSLQLGAKTALRATPKDLVVRDGIAYAALGHEGFEILEIQ